MTFSEFTASNSTNGSSRISTFDPSFTCEQAKSDNAIPTAKLTMLCSPPDRPSNSSDPVFDDT